MIAFIACRKGSTRVLNKNRKLLCGKPLFYYCLSACVAAKSTDRVIMATDDEEIIRLTQEYNFPKVEIYRRSSESANNYVYQIKVIEEWLNNTDCKPNDEEQFMLLQVTHPFIKLEDIDNAVKIFSQSNAGSLKSMAVLKVFQWDHEGHPMNFDYNNPFRTQDFPEEKAILISNGAMTLNTVERIKDNIREKKASIHSEKIIYYKMHGKTAMCDIDDEVDFMLAEQLMRYERG